MALEPFIWGAGGQRITSPEAAARQRAIAESLIGRSAKPASNWGEGLAHVAAAFTGTQLQNQAMAAEEEGRRAVAELLAGLTPESSFTDIASVYGNPWASDSQSAVAQALLSQNLQRNDPMYQMQLEQMGLELDAARNPAVDPWAGLKVVNDQVVGIGEGGPQVLGDFRDPQGDELTSAIQNYNFLISQGVDPAVAQQQAFGGQTTNVNVNTGGAGPKLGSLSNDYGYVLDPETGEPVIDPVTGLPTAAAIPGSPAALEAQAAAAAAAAQEGASIASSLESAEKTLTSTTNALDLLDNSDTPVTGTLSRPLAAISSTPAGRVRSYVGTLQSGVALGAMQRLKEASATGATGFGALSIPELQLLINDIGALDPDNTEPDIFRQTIERIDSRARRVVADIKRNVSPERIEELGLTEFLQAFGDDGSLQPPGQSQANPAIFGGTNNDPLGIR